MKQLKQVFQLLLVFMTHSACNKGGGNNDGGITNPPETATPKIIAGSGYSFLLKTDGTLWVAGNNLHGQLGDGTEIAKPAWTKVADNVADVSTKVGAYPPHSLMLKKDGTLWAAGSNFAGQFGNNSTKGNSNWVSVANNVATMSASAGHGYSFMINKAGEVAATGNNRYGQFGNGSINKIDSVWKTVANGATSAATAVSNAFLLKSDGSVWAAGLELGNGTTSSTTWVKVGDNAASVTSGMSHSFILKKDGTLWGIGDGDLLGTGSTTHVSSWAQVASQVAAVSAGEHHSLILKQDGTVWATGKNDSGELGKGSSSNSTSWVQVADNAVAISAGGSHSFVLKKDGTLWAAGQNYQGAFGDNSVIAVGGNTVTFTKIKTP